MKKLVAFLALAVSISSQAVPILQNESNIAFSVPIVFNADNTQNEFQITYTIDQIFGSSVVPTNGFVTWDWSTTYTVQTEDSSQASEISSFATLSGRDADDNWNLFFDDNANGFTNVGEITSFTRTASETFGAVDFYREAESFLALNVALLLRDPEAISFDDIFGSFEGTSQFKYFAEPQASTSVSTPGTLAIFGMGLLLLGVKRAGRKA